MALRKPRFIAGGPDEDDAPPIEQPKRLRYPCAAHQCPMPGTIFLGADGVCAWHAREPANDWPLITQAIRDWECVSRAINRARRVLTDPVTCTDGKAQREALEAEWQAIVPAVQGSGWKSRIQPKPGENLSEWARRMDMFLAARVKERQTGGSVDETKPTPFAAEVLAGLRKRPTTTDEDFA
jgi:hypothetical protein